MKKILGFSLVAAIALSVNAFAEETRTGLLPVEVSGSATLTTNVLFRGTSLSKDYASGIAALSLKTNGVHFDFYEYNEFDVTVGFANEVSGLSYDVGINNFNYLGTTTPMDIEAYAYLNYAMGDLSIGANGYYGFTGATTKMVEGTVGYSIKDIADVKVIGGYDFGKAYNTYYGASISRPCMLLSKGDISLAFSNTLVAYDAAKSATTGLKWAISYSAAF